jgi:DNA-binding transcriptional ArsR family regulator
MLNNAATAVELNDSFHALAHPVRRAIVGRLAEGPMTVGAASRGVGVSKPAVSRHLRVLEDAGIVERVVQGRTHLLTLCTHPLADAGRWIDSHRRLWERKLDVVADFLETT